VPDISIVTPSYNQARYIERTILSVLRQNLSGRTLEYVVVDGNSGDETREILERYSASIRWVSEVDRGQADAVNKGFRMTSGDLVGWLNSDDVYYPGALASVTEFFDAHPEIDVVYGDADHIDEHDAIIERYDTEPWSFERLRDVCFLSQPAVFFRRRVFDRAGMLDERLQLCMDYEYWIRLALAGIKFQYIPQTLAGSRLYSSTKTMGQRVQVHAEINDMLRARLGRVPDRWLFNYAHMVLEQKSVSRDNPFRFSVAVSFTALLAALRWNRCVSQSMVSTARGWMVNSIPANLRWLYAR
jgi:glycosyltransferase involved in cell wall biosynthesis